MIKPKREGFIYVIVATFYYFRVANNVEVPGDPYRMSRCIGIFFVSEHSVRPETPV